MHFAWGVTWLPLDYISGRHFFSIHFRAQLEIMIAKRSHWRPACLCRSGVGSRGLGRGSRSGNLWSDFGGGGARWRVAVAAVVAAWQ